MVAAAAVTEVTIVPVPALSLAVPMLVGVGKAKAVVEQRKVASNARSGTPITFFLAFLSSVGKPSLGAAQICMIGLRRDRVLGESSTRAGGVNPDNFFIYVFCIFDFKSFTRIAASCRSCEFAGSPLPIPGHFWTTLSIYGARSLGSRLMTSFRIEKGAGLQGNPWNIRTGIFNQQESHANLANQRE